MTVPTVQFVSVQAEERSLRGEQSQHTSSLDGDLPKLINLAHGDARSLERLREGCVRLDDAVL